MTTNQRNFLRGFTRVELLVTLVAIAALAILFASPLTSKNPEKYAQTVAVNNLRQIGLAMYEFETAYGSYPQNSHAQKLNKETGNKFELSEITTSNDAFKQLLVSGFATSEVMFYFKTAYSSKGPPDNDYGTAHEMLKKGEVGFGYIMRDADFALSKEGHLERALVVTPLRYHGSFEAGKFDKNICDSKAVVLRLDQSVRLFRINSNDEAVFEGKGLLQTGPDTVWGEVATPVIKNPLPK